MININPEIERFTKQYPTEVVIFVGAGASVYFDMPLMKEFFSRYFSNFSINSFKNLVLQRPIKGDDVILHCMSTMAEYHIDNAIKTKQEDLTVDLEDLIKFMLDVKNNLARPTDSNLLTALNLAITAKYPDLNAKKDSNTFYSENLWRDFVNEIDTSFKKLTRKLYDVYGRKPDDDLVNKINETYEPFLKEIAVHNRGGIAVFTTNYDLCLDVFLKKEKSMYDRPISNGFARTNADERKHWAINNYYKMTDAPIISYFNLHGSVLWKKVKDGWVYYEPDEGMPEITHDDQVALEAPVIGKGTLAICESMYNFYASMLNNNSPKYFITIGYSFRDDILADLTAAHFLRNPNIKFIYISPTQDHFRLFETNTYKNALLHNPKLKENFIWVQEKFGGLSQTKRIINKMREKAVWT